MLTDVIDAYLAKQRSLGMRFEFAGDLLRRFCRAMGNPEIDEVSPEYRGRVPSRQRSAQRNLDAEVQGLDRPVQVRRQPRVCGSLAIADDFAEAAAAANSLRLFRRRTAPLAGSDVGPADWAQPSSPGNVSYPPLAAVRKRHAYWRSTSPGLARRRPDRAGHHHPRHEVLQNTPRADRAKAQPGTD